MNERGQFEQWITSPPFEREVGRWEERADVAWPGQYREYEVELAWCAWQERARVGAASQQIVASQQEQDHHQPTEVFPATAPRPPKARVSTWNRKPPAWELGPPAELSLLPLSWVRPGCARGANPP